MIDASRSVLLVEMDDRFGVARCAETMSLLLELPAQLAIVIDLAVVADPDGAVFVRQRLAAAGQVDD
jgi:hypothetical protein